MLISFAATVFVFGIAVVVLFQLALAIGMPWGHLAMGGKFPGRFPPKMRIAALVQGVILAFLGAVVLVRSGLLLPEWSASARWLIWVVVAFSGLSVVLNVITPSKWERIIWVPVTVVLLITSIIVATN